MFRLFAFIWSFFVAVAVGKIKELIFQQFALPLLSNHFDAVSRSNLLFSRELVERSNCQEVRSWSIDNSLRFCF